MIGHQLSRREVGMRRLDAVEGLRVQGSLPALHEQNEEDDNPALVVGADREHLERSVAQFLPHSRCDLECAVTREPLAGRNDLRQDGLVLQNDGVFPLSFSVTAEVMEDDGLHHVAVQGGIAMLQ